jgi:hypothetical protein
MAKRFIAIVRGLKFGEGFLEIGDPIPRRKEDSLAGLVNRGWVQEVDESEIDPRKLAKLKALEGEVAVVEEVEESAPEEGEVVSPSVADFDSMTKAELIELLAEDGRSLDSGSGSGGSILKKDLVAALNS